MTSTTSYGGLPTDEKGSRAGGRAGTRDSIRFRGPVAAAGRGVGRWSRPGFSLLELTLVLAIIAALMAAAAWNFLGQGERAKVKVTKQTLFMIDSALSQYNLEYSSYPANLNTLITSKMLKDTPLKDSWDSDIYYDTRGASKERPFNLRSNGPDKQLGNEDDIDIWTVTRDGSGTKTGG